MPKTDFPVSLLALSILALAQFGDGAEPGLRPTDGSNPTAFAQTNQPGSAPWAVRLGPVAQHDSRIAPRVIVTEQAQQAPANQGQFVAHATGTAQRESRSRDAGNTGNPGDAVLRRWVTEVEVPARLRDFDSRIALTEAKLESFRRRQSQLSMLNVYAAPETFGFFPTDVWPGVETYNPVTVGGRFGRFLRVPRFPMSLPPCRTAHSRLNWNWRPCVWSGIGWPRQRTAAPSCPAIRRCRTSKRLGTRRWPRSTRNSVWPNSVANLAKRG
jgi:hypothetical protein